MEHNTQPPQFWKKLDTSNAKLSTHHDLYKNITDDQNEFLSAIVRKLLKNINQSNPLIYEALSHYYDTSCFGLESTDIKKIIYRMDYLRLQELEVIYDTLQSQYVTHHNQLVSLLNHKDINNIDLWIVYALIKPNLLLFLQDFYTADVLQQYNHCFLRLILINQDIFHSFMQRRDTLSQPISSWHVKTVKWWTYSHNITHPTLDYYDNRRDTFQWSQQGLSMKIRWWFLSDLPDS